MSSIPADTRSALRRRPFQDTSAGFDQSIGGFPTQQIGTPNFALPFYGNPSSPYIATQRPSSPNQSASALSYPSQGYISAEGSTISNQDAQMLHAQPTNYSNGPSQSSQHSYHADALDTQASSIVNAPTRLLQQPQADVSYNTTGHGPVTFAYGEGAYNNMVIESQNVDTSALGVDPLLWLDYMPHDVFEYLPSQNDGLIPSTHMDRGETRLSDAAP